jgi:hypothetical protein
MVNFTTFVLALVAATFTSAFKVPCASPNDQCGWTLSNGLHRTKPLSPPLHSIKQTANTLHKNTPTRNSRPPTAASTTEPSTTPSTTAARAASSSTTSPAPRDAALRAPRPRMPTVFSRGSPFLLVSRCWIVDRRGEDFLPDRLHAGKLCLKNEKSIFEVSDAEFPGDLHAVLEESQNPTAQA